MIAGASWTWWIAFHAAVVVLLTVDALLPGRRKPTKSAQLVAWVWTVVLVAVALSFAVWLSFKEGRQLALEFVAGYTIELSLSIDNLFVFLILFQGFKVSHVRQHQALLWGISGAIVMRALFIAAGVTLIQKFSWVTWIFGAVLLYAAWRLLKGGGMHDAVPGWVMKIHGREGSLLPVIIAVELTDLMFAVDSIPAVLAVSHHPFVVYTSNIAAILGLRSLYFALADLLEKFRYLHYGLGVLLAFVAAKMLVAHWIEIPIVLSLVIIGAILGVCAVASVIADKMSTTSARCAQHPEDQPHSED
jgi:tellurite resistance protein TerC